MSENRSVPDMSERVVLYHREASGMGMGLTKSLAKSRGAERALTAGHVGEARVVQLRCHGDRAQRDRGGACP